jgi:cathepsin L
MKCAAGVLLLSSSASALLVDTSAYTFSEYLSEFGKAYDGDEFKLREELFNVQLEKVNKHNQEYLEGKHTWYAAMNEYSDWAAHEQASIKTGKAAHQVHDHPFAQLRSTAEPNPSRKDWREDGVVTPVKNQGGCGSCWAFSAIEVVESHHAIQAKLQTPLKLAPQAYVNCVQNPQQCGGSGGCEGATMELAFNMTRDLGVPLESDLPYQGRDASCGSYQAAVKVDGYVKLPVNDAKALETAIATQGPVSVTVAANWMMYGGGIFSGACTESSCDLDHGVVAVGYDQDYWLVRNSWGTGWGESGYIRLSRKNDAVIYTDSTPADGVACKPYPESQQVGGESGILFDTSYPTGVTSASLYV